MYSTGGIDADSRLPFATRLVRVHGGMVEEYIIPLGKRREVFAQLYFFTPAPAMDDLMLDMHEEKTFKVRQYRVFREFGHNILTSPYYPSSGGTVIDWWPADDQEEGESGMFVQELVGDEAIDRAYAMINEHKHHTDRHSRR